MRGQAARLGNYPNLGRTGRIPGTRELPIGRTPYLVVYTVDRSIDTVIILRVLHGARLWPDHPQ
ncbi:MAG TPA: type II toxin-antitoxin system RelE/ParE family toxin [Chloroflexota bacterium]